MKNRSASVGQPAWLAFVPAVIALAATVMLPAPRVAAQPDPAQPPSVRLVRVPSRGLALHARDATLEQIAQAVARETGCAAEVDRRLRETRLSLDLSPRPPERLFATLARRASARMEVSYRMVPQPSGAARRPVPPAFGVERVTLRFPEPRPVDEVVRDLIVRVHVDERLKGKVRIVAQDHPLWMVLDRIAAQAGARWEAVVALEPRLPVDSAAAVDERRHAHYEDLSPLSSEERQEEIEVDLAALERLPADRQAEGVRRMAQDVMSLATHYQEVPGEHRGPVAPVVLGIARDYWLVLNRQSTGRRETFAPVLQALTELQRRLNEIR